MTLSAENTTLTRTLVAKVEILFFLKIYFIFKIRFLRYAFLSTLKVSLFIKPTRVNGRSL